MLQFLRTIYTCKLNDWCGITNNHCRHVRHTAKLCQTLLTVTVLHHQRITLCCIIWHTAMLYEHRYNTQSAYRYACLLRIVTYPVDAHVDFGAVR